MTIYLYNKIDINKIKFDKVPYEKYIEDSKTIHYIDISYNKSDLYMQIPKGKIISFDIENKIVSIETNINTFIKNLENLIVNTVYKYSTRWFNGKQFTINKIKNGLLSNLSKNILHLTIDKLPSLYDQYKNIINIKDLQNLLMENLDINIVCIVKLLNLQFIDNKFTYNLVLEQAKIYKKESIKEYSIIESESDSGDLIIEKEENTINEDVVRRQGNNVVRRQDTIKDISELEDEYYKE
jgi:hypothetical protein